MNAVVRFLKNWTLPVAITAGALAYFAYSNCPYLQFTKPYAMPVVSIVQPLLIFSMLFLSFCKIDVCDLRPKMSHLWLLLIQIASFAAICLSLYLFPHIKCGVVLEAAALCLICPTATSASVVTLKLKGDGADITMYTLLINLMVALVVPIFVPLINHHSSDLGFLQYFWQIMAKVFPLLICPLIAAQLVRHFLPRLHKLLTSFHDLAFYLWAVALGIAIAVTVRSIVHTNHSIGELSAIAVVSLVCCALQFGLGRLIGRHYQTPVSSCQALGQKNTVFAIWLGYTFLNPVTSIAGGFYSIWHNLYNTYQLRKQAIGKDSKSVKQ